MLSAQSAGPDTQLSGVAQWAVQVMEGIGAPGTGLAIALENLFPPLPSEVILPLAGFTASRGTFTLFEALFWTTLGSVLGAWLLDGLGAWLGRRRMRAIVAKVPFIDLEDIDKVETWFQRHGDKAVFQKIVIAAVARFAVFWLSTKMNKSRRKREAQSNTTP